MIPLKVCGVTHAEDVAALCELGVPWMGLNFWPRSSRFVEVHAARKLLASGRPACVVGLFVNPTWDELVAAMDLRLDVVQLHGDEDPEFCARVQEELQVDVMKAVALESSADLVELERFSTRWLLLDSRSPGRGGSGQVANWALCRKATKGRDNVWLAGGIHAGNAQEAVEVVRPYGVDVASGVESAPGVKDRRKIEALLRALATAHATMDSLETAT